MSKVTDELIKQLLHELGERLEKHQFYPYKFGYAFIQTKPDFVNLFILYIENIDQIYVIRARVAIQAVLVENTVNAILERPKPKPEAATIGQSLKLGDEASWRLNSKSELQELLNKLLAVFELALAYFEKHASVEEIMKILASQSIHPFTAQKLLACSYILNNKSMLEHIKARTEERFGSIVLDATSNETVKVEYVAFERLYQKLSNDLTI